MMQRVVTVTCDGVDFWTSRCLFGSGDSLRYVRRAAEVWLAAESWRHKV